MKEKWNLKQTGVALVSLALVTVVSAMASAQNAWLPLGTDQGGQQSPVRRANPGRADHKRMMRGFRFGVCVGQTLATGQPSVILPAPQPGQRRAQLDDTNKAALRIAVQYCIAQYKNGSVNSGNSSGSGVSSGGNSGIQGGTESGTGTGAGNGTGTGTGGSNGPGPNGSTTPF